MPSEQAGVRRIAALVALTVASYGLPFGALSVAAGLSIWQTCFLSMVMFTGASQFALIGIIATGGVAAGPAAIANAALLGLRNAFYGVTLSRTLVSRAGSGGWPRTSPLTSRPPWP